MQRSLVVNALPDKAAYITKNGKAKWIPVTESMILKITEKDKA